ncbi:MAG: hypothetical protein C0467_28365 [Planctomycetaceae bacterium]|nr:hypothetical protein [Planctomycetaceae bacterium]
MDPMPKLDREAYIALMRQQMEAMLGQVADAINNAPDGHIIAESECRVRDLFGTLRQKAYEVGIQMRTDAAEAAFPPSEEPHVGEKVAE